MKIYDKKCNLSGNSHFPIIPMAWSQLVHGEAEVNWAGKTWIDGTASEQDKDKALEIIGNFRTAHNYPLNVFQMTLRRKANEVENNCWIAQRIKRLSSIDYKLKKLGWLNLYDMQDMAGCRAILTTVPKVRRLVDMYKSSSIRSALIDTDDYITNPKKTGYRGIHLIYQFFSEKEPSTIHNGRKIELQFRSRLQHIWATAVETVGLFKSQALKSNRGDTDWLRFFALMGSVIAIRERSPLIPNTPTTLRELKAELKECEKQIKVESHLQLYNSALGVPQMPNVKGAHYFILVLDTKEKKITINPFKKSQLEEANNEYISIEKNKEGEHIDVVLVRVDSLKALKSTYPNYFLDIHSFMHIVRVTLG